MYTIKKVSILLIIALVWACTPKVIEEIKTTPTSVVVKPTIKENVSDCPNFLSAPNPDEAETNYVLYRDFLKEGELTTAFEYWQKVYAVSPAANGSIHVVYTDGIYLMKLTSENNSQTFKIVKQ